MFIVYFIIGSLIYWLAYTKQAKSIYRIGLFAIFFITAFRDPILGGTDSYFYQLFYKNVPTINHVFSYDSVYSFGYTLLNSLVKTFSDNYLVYQLIYSIIVIILLNVVIQKLDLSERDKCIYLFTYFCFRFIRINWVELRQNFSDLFIWLTILMASRAETNRRKVGIGVIGVFFASLFHTSAIVNVFLLPALLLLKRIPLKAKGIGVVFLSIIIYIFSAPIFAILSRYISVYIDSRFTIYAVESYDAGNLINFLLRIAFFILFCFMYEGIEYDRKETILNTFAIMVLLGSINSGIMTRMFEYYSIGLYTAMTLSYKKFSQDSRKIIAPLYWAGLMIILLRFLLITDNGLYMNYRFWWQI